MSKIYLPTDYLNKPCYVVNSDYIRVYNSTNSNNNTVYDIYFKNDYMIKQGTANYSSNTICDHINTYTDEVYYRYDFHNILFIFLSLCIIFFAPGFKLFFRMFRRFR